MATRGVARWVWTSFGLGVQSTDPRCVPLLVSFELGLQAETVGLRASGHG